MEKREIAYDFSGKTVLITGAGGVLGRDLAKSFAETSAQVVLAVRKIDGFMAGFSETLPHTPLLSEADLSQEAEIERLFDSIYGITEKVDILVNNAALQPTARLQDIDGGKWDEMMAVNVKAPHLCTLQLVKKRQRGRIGSSAAIVNIASIEADSPAPLHSHYDASKGGLLQYSRAAALELGPEGIRVNVVSPGLIDREGIERDWPDGVNRYRSASPLRRLVKTEEVCQAVLFLSSDAASGITGINVRVDTGIGATPGY